MIGSEHTFSALSIRALTTALLAEMGWLELKSRYQSVWVGFLFTDTDISSPLGWGSVSKKGMDPSELGFSTVNFMYGSMELR